MSKSGVSLVEEFLRQETRTAKSASLNCGAMVMKLMLKI